MANVTILKRCFLTAVTIAGVIGLTSANAQLLYKKAPATPQKAQVVKPQKAQINQRVIEISKDAQAEYNSAPDESKQCRKFDNNGLNVQFKYVGRDLHHVLLMNTSKTSIKIEMLGKEYVLENGDSIVIDPPNIKFVHIKHMPYHPLKTKVSKLLKNRFSTTSTYKLKDKTKVTPDSSPVVQIK